MTNKKQTTFYTKKNTHTQNEIGQKRRTKERVYFKWVMTILMYLI